MNYAGLILHWVSSLILAAEEKYGPKTGEQKQEYVIHETLKLLDRKKVITENPSLDIETLVKLIIAVINAVVALLNFLGLLDKE